MSNVWLFGVLGLCVLAFFYVIVNYVKIKKLPEGNERMVKMSAIIREGAGVFLKKEFTTIGIVILVIAVLFSLFIEKFSGLTYVLGALMSSVVCILGMKSATYANVRTANVAKESLSIGKNVKVALSGGSVSGISVQAFGMLGLLIVLLVSGVGPQNEIEGITTLSGGGIQSYQGCGIVFIDALLTNASVMRITSYSLGCSTVAMFNRVAGGNFTKAADISADILGKIRNDLPEDDSRVPNVIADFIGDNVNDIAGNCSDLLESFVATMSASIIVAVGLLATKGMSVALFNSAYIFPLVVAGGGLLGCILGLVFAQIKKMGDNPSKELNIATYISAGVSVITCGVAAYLAFGKTDANILKTVMNFKVGWASPWICAVLGIISGVAIGAITEYYTSDAFKPTKQIAEYAVEGEAFVVTKGDAVGSRSCLYPIAIIAVSLLISGVLCGTYGIAIASLGMLSFVGTTVSIDAFGPIADNAGGLAESCHLAPEVRVITDKLDSVGNTTAAIGKGFAIGSAAFATVSLIVAFIGNYATSGITPPSFEGPSLISVVAGLIIGGALIEFFCAILTDNTIRSAKELAEVGDRQLSDPAILRGEKDPDYNELVRLATSSALKRMLFPSIIALAVPLIGGAIFGVNFVLGILLGATVVAIPIAIFMGNSGGAFDNAKKFIEQGKLEGHGKGSPAHKAAVTGDTIGDTRKDVVGVSLDIFIKMMSTVSTTLFILIAVLSSIIGLF
ncbi:MAG: sodium-translocating pyrophosphatase [Clostridia bacterium]|nr:sodium-translocating pyrophosphatase [Clostridia bacterium]